MDGEIQRRVKNPLGNFSSKSCQDWAVGTHVIFFELIIANSLLIDMLLLCFDNHISCPQAVMGHILYHVISSLHPTNILFLIDTWLFEKLGILAPVSSKLGMKWEVRMKTVHRGGKKTGTKLVSSPKLEFHPHFWISLAFVPSLVWKWSLLRVRSANLLNWYPVLLTLQLNSNWGWSMHYIVKRGPKDRVTLQRTLTPF
jgi:hypothetical protein